jgi:hypothetical protein
MMLFISIMKEVTSCAFLWGCVVLTCDETNGIFFWPVLCMIQVVAAAYMPALHTILLTMMSNNNILGFSKCKTFMTLPLEWGYKLQTACILNSVFRMVSSKTVHAVST